MKKDLKNVISNVSDAAAHFLKSWRNTTKYRFCDVALFSLTCPLNAKCSWFDPRAKKHEA